MAVKKLRNARVRQKNIQKPGNRKEEKKLVNVKVKDTKALVIAQEIRFARLLANNQKKVRDKVLKNLKKWLTVRAKSSFGFTDADFMRLWKGLFYCMWMSDKPLIQEELAESLSKIVHCFDTRDTIILYTRCALKTLGVEWFGIDQHRLDKFSMLIRRIFRQTFEVCKRNYWDKEYVFGVSDLLEDLFLDQKTCTGFIMHVTDLYLEELAKVSEGHIPEDSITDFIKPFVPYLMKLDDEKQTRYVMNHIFRHLIFQSDIGIDYMEKFKAWKEAGFPCGNIDAIQKIELSDKEEGNESEGEEERKEQQSRKEKPLDPRAGKVDVELPQLKFNAQGIVKMLKQYKFHPVSTAKSRRQLTCLIREFTEFAQGNMPLGVKEIKLPTIKKSDTNAKLAALHLLEFEKQLYSDTVRKKQKRKRNGHMLGENIHDKLMADTLDEENEEDILKKSIPEYASDNDFQISKGNDIEESMDMSDNKKHKKSKIMKWQACDRNTELQSTKISLNNASVKLKKLKDNKAYNMGPTNKLAGKKSKTEKNSIGGNWDISDNIASPTTAGTAEKNGSTSVKNDDKTLLMTTTAWLTPVLKRLENEKVTSSTPKKEHKIEGGFSSKKRVKIALQRNTAQHTSEYIQQIRKSPAIPFDANKKPLAGVLKASPIPSPVNPFYKKAVK